MLRWLVAFSDQPSYAVKAFLLSAVLSLGLAGQTAQGAPLATIWLELLTKRVKAENVTAPVAARIFAYVGLGMNEALAVSGQAPPLAQALRGGFEPPPGTAGRDYDALTVLNAVTYELASELMREHSDMRQPFSAATLETRRAFRALYAETLASRRELRSEAELLASTDLGLALAERLFAWASGDGFDEARAAMFASARALDAARASEPALWRSRGPGRDPIEPFWGQLEPLSLGGAGRCHTPLSVPFDLSPGSEFDRSVREVYDLSQTLTPEQIEIAYFWDDEPLETGTLGGHLLMLAAQVAETKRYSLADTVHLYAVLGAALHDAFVSAWWSKYEVMLVRPETLIRERIDATWRPLLQTPNFPEYPSGHAVVGAAFADVMTQLVGPHPFVDPYGVMNPRAGFAAGDQTSLSRPYRSFWHAAEENAVSRLYGGVHYRFSLTSGVAQGRCVAQHLLATLGLEQALVE